MKSLYLSILFLIVGVQFLFAQVPLESIDTKDFIGKKVIVKVKEGFEFNQQIERRKSQLPFNIEKTKHLHPTITKSKKKLVSETKRKRNISKYGINRIYELNLTDEDIITAINWLQKQEWVEYAEPVYKTQPHKSENTKEEYELEKKPLTTFSWAFANAKIDYAWNTEGLDGSGVIVAVLDQGTDLDHPALAGKLYENIAELNGTPGVDDDGNGYIDDVNGYNFGVNSANVEAGSLGHGTQVAGAIVADNNLPVGSKAFGPAPGAKLLTVETWNNSVNSYINMVPAILYAAEQGARVINMSFGGINFPSWYQQDMINFLTDTYDVVFVASAGNDGGNNAYYPASYENVLSVAHSTESNRRFGGATYNYFVDVLAPGANVAVIEPPNTYRNSINGSSYATPLVAGVAALLIQKYPNLTGQQIAELIRTTAEDVYSLSGNNSSTFQFKLGKGKIDAEKALTEKDLRPAIRMSDFTYESAVGRYILLNDDNLTLRCDFTNYLAESSNNLNVSLSLSEDSPNCNATEPNFPCLSASQISIVSGNQNLGSMETLETVTKDFVINIDNIDPLMLEHWRRMQLKLTFEDVSTGYTDYQYFELYVRPNFLTKVSRFNMGMNTDGRIGKTGTLALEVTPGIYYDNISTGYSTTEVGNKISKAAGFIAAKNDGSTVVNAIPTTWTTGGTVTYTTEDDDFTRLKDMRVFDGIEGGETSFQGTFDDIGRTPPNGSIGLEVDHKIIGFRNSSDLDYFVLEYTVKNKSGSDFDSLFAGVFFDWDLHSKTATSSFAALPYKPNQASWNDNEKLGYVYSTTEGQYVGVHVLNPNPSYYALDLNASNIGDNGVDIDPITGGFSDAEKYQALANRVAKKTVTTGSDVAQMIGTTLYNLSNNDEQKMVMIICFSPTEAGLATVKNKAITKLGNRYQKANQPIVDLIGCPTETILKPRADGTYNFYKSTNLTEAIFTGREYEVPPADLGTTYHITNVNETLESNAAIIVANSITPTTPSADFSAPSVVNRSINSNVTFTDASTNAGAWEWNFGDGSEVVNTQSPIHDYKAQGSYNVTLTINKGSACETSITKSITIQSESPLPTISATISTCKNENLTITPSGGTNFKFYDAPLPTGNLLFTGNTYEIPNLVANQTVYVTNIDSALESNAIMVQAIANDFPTANFTISSERRINNNITFTPEESGLTITNWDFGDGDVSTQTNPTHQYTNVGTYTITLTATNASGCEFSTSQQITTILDIDAPVIADLMVCSGNMATIQPTPTNGTFRFYSSLPISSANLLLEGSEFSTPPLTSNQTYYITQIKNGNESDPSTVNVTILKNPTANFSISSERRINNDIVFTTEESGLTITNWDFGDGDVSSQANPTHQYTSVGTYTITLTATNASGCEFSTSQQITTIPDVDAPVIADLTVCSGNMATIQPTPTNGTFRFYSSLPISSANLLLEGSEFSTPPLSSNQTYYITQIKNGNESDPSTVNVSILQSPNASFSAPSIVNRNKNSVISFTSTSSNDVVKWRWNFGDGSAESVVENPEHSYNRQGEFTVTLEVENSNGCSHITTKQIVIQSESPEPLVNVIPPICPNSEVTISPINGTTFRFYENNNLSKLLDEGNDYTITNFAQSTSIFVVNIDSAIQSNPIEVMLTLNSITADFEVATTMSQQVNGSIQVRFSTDQQADKYIWNLGDGNIIEGGKDYTHSFDVEGTYNVTLTIIDALGCSVNLTKTIQVKATEQSIASGIVLPSNLPISIENGGNATVQSPFLRLENNLIIKENAVLTVPRNSTLIVEGDVLIQGTLLEEIGAKIILKKNLIIEGGNLLSGNNSFGTIIFQNNVPVEISNAQATHLDNLSLEGDEVILKTQLNIYKELRIRQNDLVTNDFFGLVLHSNTDNTAILFNEGNGTVKGNNVRIQRFIPNNSKLPEVQNFNGTRYHQMASPTQNFPIVSLDDEVVTGNFQLNINPIWNTQNGQGVSINQLPNTFLYDERYVATQNDNAVAGWRTPFNNSLMEIGRGYAIRIKAGSTLTYKGAPNNGDIDMPISRNNNIENTLENTGWALLGNPYPSPISATSFLQENSNELEESLFVFVATGEFTGFYGIITASGLSVPSFMNLESLAPSQGFFVRKKENGEGIVHFNNAMRNDNNNTFFRKSTEENLLLARVQIAQASSKHETLIVRNNHKNEVLGLVETSAFLKSPVAIYHSDKHGNQWIISSVNNKADTLRLDINLEEVGAAELSLVEFNDSYSILLEDRLNQQWHQFSKNQTFQFFSNEKIIKNRFFIHLKSKDELVNDTKVYLFENTLTVAFPEFRESLPTIKIYNTVGKEIKTINSQTFNGFEYNTRLENISSQILLVKILDDNGVQTFKVLK